MSGIKIYTDNLYLSKGIDFIYKTVITQPHVKYVLFTADYIYKALDELSDCRAMLILINSFDGLNFLIPSSLSIKPQACLEEWKGLFNENYELQSPECDQTGFSYLTARERQVISMSYRGIDINRIARQLGIKASSVYNHRLSACKKLGCNSYLDFLRLCHLQSSRIYMKKSSFQNLGTKLIGSNR
ncbi:helix-turn-helix transcriptional regulator [Enterobacter roggenkampii]|uniref:helix-turn-helix transcriptional regulator n=1 Tax=Enterobacter roggenkampii TaxID=1812935 RepID=UPI002DB87CE9|nr:LuxR C-terminal-related transcriptional regulator [Enterobacter roggenkampii]MEB5887498.1 LuxR C-terminal-related transcriptional regulator [Enterobacter roggenkampii]